MLIIHVVVMVNAFKAVVDFIVNVILVIMEINVNVSYKHTIFHIACNIHWHDIRSCLHA